MQHMYYRLEGHKAVPCTIHELAKAKKINETFDIANRRVEETVIGDVRISTVFLAINHQWGSGPPLLFETMIFGGKHDSYQRRYSTWDEAVKGHKAAVKLVRGNP